MTHSERGCVLCDPLRAGPDLQMEPLWSADGWQAWAMTMGPAPGFCLLVGDTHVPTLAELGDTAAGSLGPALARLGRTVAAALGPARLYLYSFGDHVDHLHFGMAPHFPGDELLGSDGVVTTAADPEDPRWRDYLGRLRSAATTT